jgi:hypothetical protein
MKLAATLLRKGFFVALIRSAEIEEYCKNLKDRGSGIPFSTETTASSSTRGSLSPSVTTTHGACPEGFCDLRRDRDLVCA